MMEINIQHKHDRAMDAGIDLSALLEDLKPIELIRDLVGKPLYELEELLFDAKRGLLSPADVLGYIQKSSH